MAITAINLFSLDGSNGFRLNDAGYQVSSAGDINGDGFDDVMVSVYTYPSPFVSGIGSSYVVFGQASGFSAAINLARLDGSNGFHLGSRNSDSNPVFISDAGDVNGDGFDDVMIGTPFADLDGAVVDGVRLGSSVSNAGDVNGDGFDDVIIGASGADPNGVNSGSSYVVFGKAAGFDATMDLSNLDENDGFRLDGELAFDYSGNSVSNAGDVNGDGFDDLIVGASYGGDSNVGASYVIFGRSNFSDDDVIQGTPKNDKLTGTAAAEHFKAGNGNDSMVGHGGADVFEGEAGNDYIRVADLDFESVDGGTGRETFWVWAVAA